MDKRKYHVVLNGDYNRLNLDVIVGGLVPYDALNEFQKFVEGGLSDHQVSVITHITGEHIMICAEFPDEAVFSGQEFLEFEAKLELFAGQFGITRDRDEERLEYIRLMNRNSDQVEVLVPFRRTQLVTH
jgi:hypothetical protein